MKSNILMLAVWVTSMSYPLLGFSQSNDGGGGYVNPNLNPNYSMPNGADSNSDTQSQGKTADNRGPERWRKGHHPFILGVCVGQTLSQEGVTVPISPENGGNPTLDPNVETAMKGAVEACRAQLNSASPEPSASPSVVPSDTPTGTPTTPASATPTGGPSNTVPSNTPSGGPSVNPTPAPTDVTSTVNPSSQ